MQLADKRSSTYIGFGKDNNDEDPNFKVGNHVRISNSKNVFANVCSSNLSEEVFVIKKNRYRIYVTEDLNGEKIFGTWYEKE